MKKVNYNQSGYSGSSMSNRAIEAYENGEKPKSKWTKETMLSAIQNYIMDTQGINFLHEHDVLKKIETMKKDEIFYQFFHHSSWHHTGKYMCHTDFYSLNTNALDELFINHQKEYNQNLENSLQKFEKSLKTTFNFSLFLQGNPVIFSMPTITKVWKIYGIEGHRQRESFFPSSCVIHQGKKIITVALNSDVTKTNDYTILCVTSTQEKYCDEELSGQLSDGIFENSRTGKVEEIPSDQIRQYTRTIEKIVYDQKQNTLKEQFANDNSSLIRDIINLEEKYCNKKYIDYDAVIMTTFNDLKESKSRKNIINNLQNYVAPFYNEDANRIICKISDFEDKYDTYLQALGHKSGEKNEKELEMEIEL